MGITTIPGRFPALGAWAGQSLPRAQTPAEAIAELLANPPQTVPKVPGYPPQRNVPSTGPLAPLYVEGIPADMPVGTQVETPLRPGVDALPASYRPNLLPRPPVSPQMQIAEAYGGTPQNSFTTPLPFSDEARFQMWKRAYAPNDSGQDYDLRAAYKAGLTPGADGHWPDAYKKPNHPTFSDESVYAGYGSPGSWNGDTFVPPRSAGLPQPPMQRAPFQLSALSAVMGAGRNPNTVPRVPRAPLGQMAPQVSTATDTGGATMNGQPITLGSVLALLRSPGVRQANSPVMAAMNGKPSNFANPAYIPPGGLANYGGAYQSAFQNGVRDNWDRTQMQADEELRQKRLTGNY